MTWHFEHQANTDYLEVTQKPYKVKKNPVVVLENKLPLVKKGVWLGKTRVWNPSTTQREVRLCCPSNHPVKLWLNSKEVITNPGSQKMRPSYHSNAPHHYGTGILKSGWNEIIGAWNITTAQGETHCFLTSPDGAGYGDLVFRP